ncbi:MAG: PHP domain-containing protein [Candidatus Faecivicinus sp.]|nr:PHP domain-containing protein [Candidatus Faecivicinus sp.]
MKWELHAHCCETSLCGHVPAEELVKSYSGAGYTGLVLTDHYNEKTLDALTGTPEEKVEKWLRGYEIARKTGEECGLTVLFGLEARLPANENDYLIFGATPALLREHPLLHLQTLPALHALVHSCGAILVQAHPFREVCAPAPAEDLDGVEVFNGHPRHDSRNPLAMEFAIAHPHLIRTSGSDYHRTQDLATGGIETDRAIHTPAGLVQCLKDNAFTRIGG